MFFSNQTISNQVFQFMPKMYQKLLCFDIILSSLLLLSTMLFAKFIIIYNGFVRFHNTIKLLCKCKLFYGMMAYNKIAFCDVRGILQQYTKYHSLCLHHIYKSFIFSHILMRFYDTMLVTIYQALKNELQGFFCLRLTILALMS